MSEKKFQKFPEESAFINAETRGMTHRIIWCNISKKLERGKLNEKYNELHQYGDQFFYSWIIDLFDDCHSEY